MFAGRAWRQDPEAADPADGAHDGAIGMLLAGLLQGIAGFTGQDGGLVLGLVFGDIDCKSLHLGPEIDATHTLLTTTNEYAVPTTSMTH